MTHTDLDSILDECLARMAAGESLDACLKQYPRHATALRPLLSVAAGLHALPRMEPSADAVQAGQQRMLAAVREQKRTRDGSISPLARYAGRLRNFFVPRDGVQMRHVVRFAVAMVLVLLVGTNLAVVASAGSIPGDPLYGVKRSWEEARLALTLREQDREQLREQLMERRQDEVREMVQQGREATLDLEGILRASGKGEWAVDGLTLLLSEKTVIEGQLEPGARVWVRAQVRGDGSLAVLRVRVRSRLRPPTAIEPSATPDDVRDGRHTPTMTPAPQRTPEPARSPHATSTPQPSATSLSDETPEPEPTSNSDRTPGSTETNELDDMQGPTRTGEADHTPGPAETREADHTPRPPETHEPDDTPGPSESPESEHTPDPTGEPQHTPESTGEPQHTPESTGEPQHTPESTGEPQHAPEPTDKPQYTPEPTGEPEHKPETAREPHDTPEPTG